MPARLFIFNVIFPSISPLFIIMGLHSWAPVVLLLWEEWLKCEVYKNGTDSIDETPHFVANPSGSHTHARAMRFRISMVILAQLGHQDGYFVGSQNEILPFRHLLRPSFGRVLLVHSNHWRASHCNVVNSVLKGARKMKVYKKCPKCGDAPTFEPDQDIFLMCPCGWLHPEFNWHDSAPADELPEYD